MSAAAGGAADNNSSSTMSDIVKLNVGGHTYVTTRATLCAEENSVLASMFRPESKFAPPPVLLHDDNDVIFLDRNPAIFGHVLDYLRNGCRLVHDPPEEHLKLLRAEADFFGLEGLKNGCDDRLQQARAQQPLTAVPHQPLTKVPCRESHKKIVSSWGLHR